MASCLNGKALYCRFARRSYIYTFAHLGCIACRRHRSDRDPPPRSETIPSLQLAPVSARSFGVETKNASSLANPCHCRRHCRHRRHTSTSRQNLAPGGPTSCPAHTPRAVCAGQPRCAQPEPSFKPSTGSHGLVQARTGSHSYARRARSPAPSSPPRPTLPR